MKLLVITQKVDKEDSILGFFHRWIEEFANHTEKVTVVCLEKGKYELPSNVKVLSLGKEKGVSKIGYILNFFKYIWQERNEYDNVFVHMNPEYAVLGGVLWKIWKKRIFMWYVHKQSNLKLRMATKFSNIIFTSSSQSFSLKSRKVEFVGHGVDVEKFVYSEWNSPSRTLVHVGRITPIKNCVVLVEALALLKDSDPNWKAVFIGEAISDRDLKYKEKLKTLIKEKNLESSIHFEGSLKPEDITRIFANSYASVNMTPTGGMDKAVLESWVSGCPAFSSNEIFCEVFGEQSDKFIFEFRNAQDLKDKIVSLTSSDKSEDIIKKISSHIRKDFGVRNLVTKLINNMNK